MELQRHGAPKHSTREMNRAGDTDGPRWNRGNVGVRFLIGFFCSFALLPRDLGGQIREGENGGKVQSCHHLIFSEKKNSSLKWMSSEHNVKPFPLPGT